MILPNEAVEEFQQIWLKEYGQEINKVKAEKIAVKWLGLMKSVYRPIPKSDEEKLKQYE